MDALMRCPHLLGRTPECRERMDALERPNPPPLRKGGNQQDGGNLSET
jgi:hypothetical protein